MKAKWGWIGILFGLLLASATTAVAALPAQAREELLRAPLRFEPNRGQSDPQVRFLARGAGYGMFLTDDEAVLRLALPSRASAPSAAVLRLRLQGARPARPEARMPQAGRSHYLRTDTGRAALTDLPHYAEVVQRGRYPGVDLVWYGSDGQVEYDFVLAPGADPGAIVMRMDGAQQLEVSGDGALNIHLGGRTLVQRAPVAFQYAEPVLRATQDATRLRHRDAARERVPVRYRLLADGSLGFQLGAYDHTRPLIIDPVLVYSSYLGGLDSDYAQAVAVGSGGAATVVGASLSADFPIVAGVQPVRAGDYDAFVAKFAADGSSLVYSTFFGGAGSDWALGVDLSAGGKPWVSGYLGDPAGGRRAFLLRLSFAGDAIEVQRTFGNLPYDTRGTALAIDSQGKVYLCGSTSDPGFPVLNAQDPSHGGDYDGFLRRYSDTGALEYSTLIGGAGREFAQDCAVGGDDLPVVVGSAGTAALDTDRGYVLKYNAAGTALVYNQGIDNGPTSEAALSVAVDASNLAWVGGSTDSPGFPLLAALDSSYGGNGDGYLRRYSASGVLQYSSFIGGPDYDRVNALALDAANQPYAAGRAGGNGFVVSLNAAGSALLYSAILGPGAAYGLDADASGNAFVVGEAYANYPTTAGAYDRSFGGQSDAFIARIAPTLPTLSIVNPTLALPENTPSGTATVQFALSAPSASTVTVAWATANDTAVAEGDYGSASGVISFAPGQTSASITVPVYDDFLIEADERFFVNLSDPHYVHLPQTQASITLANDDLPGTLRFSASSYSVTEGQPVATVTVQRSGGLGAGVSVQYASANGSALAGSDYTASAGTLSFAGGVSQMSFNVPIIDDLLDEDSETVDLALSGPTQGATLGVAAASLSIADNDAPPTLSVAGCATDEGNVGSRPCNFTVNLSAASGRAIGFASSTVSGSALASQDFSGHANLAHTLAAGQTSLVVAVPVLGDGTYEADEEFTLQLSSLANASPGSLTATGSIRNDDPVPTLSAQGCSVTEGNTGSTPCVFTLQLSAPSQQLVSLKARTETGTAGGSDFTAFNYITVAFSGGQTTRSVTVQVSGDTLVEGNESFTLQLFDVDGAQPGTLDVVGSIVDDDNASLSISDTSLSEGDTGTRNASLTVSLSPASALPVSVQWSSNNAASVDANASFESPLVPAGSFQTFQAGQDLGGWTVTSGSVDLVHRDFWAAATHLQSLDLNGAAPGEIHQDLALTPGQVYGISFMLSANPGCAPGLRTFEVLWAGAVAGRYQLDSTTVSAPALAYGMHQLQVTATAATQRLSLRSTTAGACGPVIDAVHVKPAGQASASGDYDAASGTLSFAPGETSKTLSVAVRGDYAIEPAERFWVDLASPTNALIADARGDIDIQNDDLAGSLSLQASAASAAENSGSIGLVVVRSGGLAQDVGAVLTPAAGTAGAGSDFDATAQRLHFSGGQSSRTAGATLLDDALDEDDETFTAALNGAFGGASIGATATATATIVDDDATPALSIDGNGCSVVEGHSGTVHCSFVARLSAVSGRNVSFTTATANGSATAGSDYTAHSNVTRTLAAGSQTLTVLVPVLGDTLDEADEAFSLNFTAIGNATPGSLSATGTIVDDDGPATPGILRLREGAQIVSENAGSVQVVVERSGGSSGAASVQYATANGSAQAGTDYGAASGTLNWAAGDATPRTITLTLVFDPAAEAQESFTLNLSQASGSTLGTPAMSTITIVDGSQLLHANGFE